ncbi:MAG TPA: hypothetical protein VJH63_03995 [Candidatus Paceibacterota bacterium]
MIKARYNNCMRSHKHLKEKAIELRKVGKSYSEILKILNLPSKGTLSLWFRDIQLNMEERKRLEKNMKLATDRGLKKFNVNRSKRILEENQQARLQGILKIGAISKRELLLIGSTLYWGEGTKAENKGSAKAITFTNSDPLMIAVFMRFVRTIWNVEERRIRAGIHIYPSIKPADARKYWSKVTRLPPERFYIVNQVSRASQGKRAYNLLPYGTAAIKINNRKLFYDIKGMIQGVINGLKNL